MRIILVGPPGCGKGTQAKLLSKRMKLEHIGTGDLLREAIRNETSVGLRAKPFVEVGNLVPDELVNDLVSERFQRDDRPKTFILDGYPRTLMQAKSLDSVLALHDLLLNAVVLLDVCDAEIVKRVTGRWSCPKLGCKATFHTLSNPSKISGICDDCHTVLVQREDDNVETVKSRLTVYHKDTVPLLPYYEQHRLLKRIHGAGDIEEIYQSMVHALSI